MTGTPDMPGLTPRSIGEMFHLIGEKKNCTVRVSTYFVELYNDAVVVSDGAVVDRIVCSDAMPSCVVNCTD